MNSDILDELSIGLVEAWSESISKNYMPAFYHKVGDTLTIFNETLLIKETSDTLIARNLDCPECYIKLPGGTKFKITEISEYVVNLETAIDNDSTARGYLFKDRFLEITNPGLDYQRKKLLNYFENEREELKIRLMKKYGLSEEEFYRTVGTKYSEKTGNPGFSF